MPPQPRPAGCSRTHDASAQQLVAPQRIGHALGSVVEESKLGPTPQEEGVVEAKQGDTGTLGVADRVNSQAGELLLGLIGPALVVGGNPHHRVLITR